MKLSDFISTYLPLAQKASKKFNVPEEYILAIAAIESFSGNKLSKLASKYNNFGGIKYNPRVDDNYVELKTLEYIQNQYKNIYQKFAVYSNPLTGFLAIGNVAKKHYVGNSIPEKQRNLFSKYATDHAYISKVKNVQRLIQKYKKEQSVTTKVNMWPLLLSILTISIVYLEKRT
jgi:flagellum-specific peptidoglycan hydrolase FlgJ